MGKEIVSSLKDEGDDKNDVKNDETLVGVIYLNGHERIIDSGSGGLGLSFYHYGDNGSMNNG